MSLFADATPQVDGLDGAVDRVTDLTVHRRR
jgi:hypothetical protein